MSAILAVAGKELREMLRDGNTLLYTLLFPVVFYPFLIWGVFQLTLLEEGLAETQPPRVVFEGPAEVADALLEAPIEEVAGDELAVRRGRADVLVTATPSGEALAVDVAHQSTLSRSTRALGVVHERLDELREVRVEALTAAHGQEPGALQAWTLDTEDVAPSDRTLAHGLSLVLPAMTLMVTTVAAMYPAIDVVVGEKERGTIETTLVAAAPRLAVVAGKLLAVIAVVMLALLGNLFATGLCVAQGLAMLQEGSFDAGISLSAGSVALALPTLLVTVTLVSSLMVLVALPARSFKEAQNLTTAAIFVIGGLAMVSSLPLTRLDPTTALVPMMNLGLVLREALDGRTSLGLSLLAIAECVVFAALAVVAGLRVAQSEDYLFRGRVPRWLSWLGRIGGAE